MCWTGTPENRRKKASSDIEVFKVVIKKDDGKYIPYYYSNDDIIYEDGKTYFQKRKIKKYFGRINEGFHSFSNSLCVIKKHIKYCDEYFYLVGSKNKGVIMFSPCSNYIGVGAIIKCIIPTGTIYYENDCGEIVSESIKIIGEMIIS